MTESTGFEYEKLPEGSYTRSGLDVESSARQALKGLKPGHHVRLPIPKEGGVSCSTWRDWLLRIQKKGSFKDVRMIVHRENGERIPYYLLPKKKDSTKPRSRTQIRDSGDSVVGRTLPGWPTRA